MSRMTSLLRTPVVAVALLFLAPWASHAAPQPPVRVAVFSDSAFVDEASLPPNAEGPSIRATLTSQGFSVFTFSGAAAANWRAVANTNRADVLLIPELEIADLGTAMAADAEVVMRDFVAAGGVLVIHGDQFGRAPLLLNQTFGFATVFQAIVFGQVSNPVDPGNGTRFLKGPASLGGNNGLYGIGTLPVGSRVLFQSAGGVPSVVLIPVGAGRIIYIGFDWFNALPTGTQDGGWLDVLRRAVLEGRTPMRRIAFYDDPAYVDTANGESDSLQATLVSQDNLVTTFTGVTSLEFDTALGPRRRPRADVLVFPEQEAFGLSVTLDLAGQASIRNFVGTGGTLVVHGSTGSLAAVLLNTVFGYTTANGGFANVDSTKTAAVDGTLFVKTPDLLSPNSLVVGIANLPVGAKSLYEAGGVTTVAQIPYGEGNILYVGWDWFGAAPSGVIDGGWLAVLDAAIRTSPPARRVAVWSDPAYVNSDTGINSEQANVRATLVSRGHHASPFLGVLQSTWSSALAKAEVLMIPDLEVAAATSVLTPQTRADIVNFVKRGGLFVAASGLAGRGALLANEIFGFALVPGAGGGPYPATDDRLGTPFALGAGSLPANNAVTTVTGIPAGGRAIYANGADAVVVWVPVGAGHVLLLGWDWYQAAPGGGAQDGGWIDIFDLAVQSTHSRARRVAVFDDGTYVDSSSGDVGAESDNVQATLAVLDHAPAPFTGTDEAAFRTALASADVLLIPEQEGAPLAPDLPAASQEVIRDFVAAGGALILHSYDSAGLLNTVFGFDVALTGTPSSPQLSTFGMLGTRFAGGPSPLLNADATASLMAPLPFGGRQVYSDSGGNSPVAWIPYGLGRILYIGFDWYDAAPIGSQDEGWVDVLDRAVQEARPRSRAVAVFDDAVYVDTTNNAAAESDVLQSALVAGGHGSAPFTGVTPELLSAGLAKSQVLVIPELENLPLLPALSAAGQQALRDYVARGGSLVTSVDQSSFNLPLVNTVFGLALTQGPPSATAYPLSASAAGTTFADGPVQLLPLNGTEFVSGLPPTATAFYAAGGEALVASVPYGAGKIVLLGWDFYALPPYLGSDSGQAAWFDVLGRAIDAAQPAARRVAIYADPAYIDVGPTFESEGTNLQALLLRQEHAVVQFAGTLTPDFAEALSRADVLLIPEQEVAALTPVLGVNTLDLIAAFVQGGGGLIVNGSNVNAPRSANLLNAILGITTNEAYTEGDPPAALSGPIVSTQFAGGPALLTDFSATSGITGLPAGSSALYVVPAILKNTVALIPRGYGRVVFLGWDFYDAAPLGSINDAAWNDVLDRAVREGLGGDIDVDGVSASSDVCPITADPAQLDGDVDLVGDACDSCLQVANPRVLNGDAAFLAVNPWATLTSAQRDDDHDGFGNLCDAKFVGLPTQFVGALDLNQFRASNGENRTLDTCGTSQTRPCAIFDLDQNTTAANSIGALDLNRFRALNGVQPGPKCTICPLPCQAGANGTCGPTP